MSPSVAEVNKDGGGPLVSLHVDVNQDIGSSASDSETPLQKGKQIPQSQTTSSQTRSDKQRNVPHFDAWENEEFDLTALFENTRKTKNEGTSVADNELQMNRDITDLPVHAQSSVQTQTQAQIKVPQFGDWEREGGEGSTVALDNLKKNESKSMASQSNGDVGPMPQEGRAKVPQFGAWEGQGHVLFNAYFDYARKTKDPKSNRNLGPPPQCMSPEFGSWENYTSSGPPVLFECMQPPQDRGGMRREEIINYRRNPLIRDFVADRARRLPSTDDDAYGGGVRREETINHGRNPLMRDIVAHRPWRLPSTDDDAYGGGMRREETINYRRNPLISDIVADTARSLPSPDDGTNGRGTRMTYDQRLGEPQLQNSNANRGIGGLTLKQKHTHRINRSVKSIGKIRSCFRWI